MALLSFWLRYSLQLLNLITWYYGIPSSSSHAIIGAIAGAAIAAAGFAALNYKGFIKIIEALILSPIIAFVLGFILYSIVKLIFKDSNLAKTNKQFRRVQIVTAALQSYTHGTNDAQKAMGIITMALITANLHTSANDIPLGAIRLRDSHGSRNINRRLENHQNRWR